MSSLQASRILAALVALAASLATHYTPAWGAGPAPVHRLEAPPAFAPGRILVGMQREGARPEFTKALAKAGVRSLDALPRLDIVVAEVEPGTERDAIARLKLDPSVRFAEVDHLMPAAAAVNDPARASGWHLDRIRAPIAWDRTMGAGVVIAILDTGVDATHPDLAAQIVPGWNFYDNNDNTDDVAGHGTAVAGTAAAATNNGIGVAAVAGGARIMPVRVASPSSYTYWSTAAKGIVYAADHGARVVNLSYEGAVGSAVIQAAATYLRAKGGVLIVSAGNTGAVDRTAPTHLMLVVSATDETDALAGFSTYGEFVSMSAPGNNILSTLRGGNYVYWWGTSFAAPVVAGAAALVLSVRPDFTAAQVEATLMATAVDLGDAGPDARFGAGRLDVGAAVQFAESGGTPDLVAPVVAIASPQAGAVAGTVTVDITAADNVGVARVDFVVNGTRLASIAAPPYRFAWDSTAFGNAVAVLTAIAHDAAGNVATSAPVAITVANAPPPDTTPPWVVLYSPGAGTLTQQVTVSATAGDNVGVTRVDFRIDGATVATTNTAPYQFTWTTTGHANGSATLEATAYDAAGNSAKSAGLTVNVFNPPPPVVVTPPIIVIPPVIVPTIPPLPPAPSPPLGPAPPTATFVNPTAGMLVSGNVAVVTAAVGDDAARTLKQTLYIDGIARIAVRGRQLSFLWNTRRIASGTHRLAVVVRDATGRTATIEVQVVRR